MIRKQHAQNKRPDILLDADKLEDIRTDQRQRDAEKNQELAVTNPVEHPVYEKGQGYQHDQHQGPERWQLAQRQGNENHCRDILHNQHTDGGLTMPGAGRAEFVEHLHSKNRAGK